MSNTRRRHLGAWRAACAVPSLCGSVIVLAVLFGGAGDWANLALAAWVLPAIALFARPAERIAVHLVYDYCRPDPAEAATLDPLRRQALRRARLDEHSADWYVRRNGRHGVNGFAAGRRSVAVSRGMIEACQSGALSEGQAVALLTHELGHLADGSTKYNLALGWLCAPWRIAAGVVGAVVRGIARRAPGARVGWLLMPVVGGIAIVQLAQQGQWPSVVVLVGLGLVVWVQPLADAAVSRASEHTADAYTARLGYGADLAAALREFHDGENGGRWRASHPPLASRVERLSAASAA